MNTKAAARRAGILVRNAMYRGVTVAERLVNWRNDEPVPPAHLRFYYYRTLDRKRFARACEDVRNELMLQGLRPEHRVLDIGSGLGNLALGCWGISRAATTASRSTKRR